MNIGGTTIHSGHGIKLEKKLLGLSDKSKVALRSKLSEVKFLIIDELYRVLSDLWTDTNSSLKEIFLTIPQKTFAGFSVVIVGDFLHPTPVKGKFIF